MDFRILNGREIAKHKALPHLQEVFTVDTLRIEAVLSKIKKNQVGNSLYIVLGTISGYQESSGKLSYVVDIFSYLAGTTNDELEEKIYRLEGRFAILCIKEGKVSIFLDKYSKLDVFFKSENNITVAGTRLDYLDNVGEHGYHQEALIHTLTYYGYRPPKKHTLYNDVRRIGVGQILTLDNGKVNLKTRPHQPHVISDYTERENDEYVDHFLNRLEKTGSSEGNVVFLSSGWDSTSILAGLVHIFGKRKVSAIIGRMKLSERSGVCNRFEIDRASKIADYYDIPLEIVDFEYLQDGASVLEKEKELLKQRQLYSLTALSHSQLCRKASETAKGKSIFAGEISDGAHNLGFSQYATIFHQDHDFRQYSDKMASYLFGPTFFQTFVEGKHNEDLIYKILGEQKGSMSLDKGHSASDMLISFFLRNGRYPGWSLDNVAVITKKGGENYTNEFYEHYLSAADNSLNVESLYSWYLHFYNSFHWQGSTVSTFPLFADAYDVNLDLPFWDANIQNFLSQMPEYWGRGLDLKPTKYPLKWMLENHLDYPMHLQTGPHSYTYDVDHSFNHAVEVFYHSKMKKSFQDALKDKPYHDILDKEYFNINYYDKIVDQYLQDKEMDIGKFNDLVPLAYLCYFGWY